LFDAKLLRSNEEAVRTGLLRRGKLPAEIDLFAELDKKRRDALQSVEQLKNRRNIVSQEVARLKKARQDASGLIEEMRAVGDRIKQIDELVRATEEELNMVLLSLPNLPNESVPQGLSEADNVEIRAWGEPPKFDFEPKAHWDLGKELGLFDLETAAKVTGSRYAFLRGQGARLERALINFMMDLHSGQHGYEELLPPYIVNKESLTGTGQLPKFAEDVYRLEGTDEYLIPTAEVPVTNYYRDEILSADRLPVKFVAYSACFRSEAGAAGRDTRGLIRQHQFNKIELVKLTKPEDSYAELETLTANAEKVLQLLELPYRVVCLCAGDLGFSSAKTYDIEVWLPSSGTYREISSCSNFEDFQARRANIRFRRDVKEKPEFVHTLNGSGLAVGRTMAALLEIGQQEDGSIAVPKVLQEYMGGITKLSARQ
jgi:seryl-tRNA synthetase